MIRVDTLITKTLIYLAVEILLSLLGLDNLADYAEFRLGQEHLPEARAELTIAHVPDHYEVF